MRLRVKTPLFHGNKKIFKKYNCEDIIGAQGWLLFVYRGLRRRIQDAKKRQ
jgi:hypothetical protein